VGIGASVLLIAVGAILTFALNVSVGWLDLHVVGWILMGAGALGLVFVTLIWRPRSRAAVTTDVPPAEIHREEQMPRY
jgi:Na+/proline symporter